MPENCIFCKIYKDPKDTVLETAYFFVKRDIHPVTSGHSLVIPKRHLVSFFELKPEEWADLQLAIAKTTKEIEKSKPGKKVPDGYNFGINEGRAAGRVVDHLHLHVVPRYLGDVVKPEGGVRNIIP